VTIQLSDEEFLDLVDIGFRKRGLLFRSRVGLTSIQRSLLDRSLMKLEMRSVPVVFDGRPCPDREENWYVLMVSREGYQEMNASPFRLALTLIDLGHFEYISTAVWKLSKEQLPAIFACEDEGAREAALRRLNELKGGDNR